jgi:hypothetical protein
MDQRKVALRTLALAYLRLGERINCIKDHSGQSCIFPIAGSGVHGDKTVLKEQSSYTKKL